MAFNRSYNASNVEEHRSFEALPVGDYDVKINAATDKISQSSGKDMIVLEIEVTTGPHKGAKLWSYIVDDQYADQKVFDIMQSCGRPIPPNITSQTFRAGLYGRVRTKQRTYNNETRAEINYWILPKPGQTPVAQPTTTRPADVQNPAPDDNKADDIPF